MCVARKSIPWLHVLARFCSTTCLCASESVNERETTLFNRFDGFIYYRCRRVWQTMLWMCIIFSVYTTASLSFTHSFDRLVFHGSTAMTKYIFCTYFFLPLLLSNDRNELSWCVSRIAGSRLKNVEEMKMICDVLLIGREHLRKCIHKNC